VPDLLPAHRMQFPACSHHARGPRQSEIHHQKATSEDTPLTLMSPSVAMRWLRPEPSPNLIFRDSRAHSNPTLPSQSGHNHFPRSNQSRRLLASPSDLLILRRRQTRVPRGQKGLLSSLQTPIPSGQDPHDSDYRPTNASRASRVAVPQRTGPTTRGQQAVPDPTATRPRGPGAVSPWSRKQFFAYLAASTSARVAKKTTLDDPIFRALGTLAARPFDSWRSPLARIRDFLPWSGGCPRMATLPRPWECGFGSGAMVAFLCGTYDRIA